MKKLVVSVVVAAIAAAACSSTKSGSSSSSTGAIGKSSGGAPGVTATEIHLGALVYKAFYGDAVVGAEARAARANAAGGVNGRKIVIDNVLDDGQDNNTDVTAAKTLVEQDHEFALLPVMTASLESAGYLEAQKVPFFGWSIQPVWCGKQYGFGFEGNDCDPTTTPLAGDTVAIEQKLFPDHTAQGKTIALMSEDNNSAEVALRSFGPGWVQHGARLVLQDSSMPSPPAVVGDYTPYAQKVMTAAGGKPADMLIMIMSVSDTLGLYKKLLQLGYKGVIQDFDLYDPRVAAPTPGLVTEVEFAPYEQASSIPSVQQMITDLKAKDPNVVLSQPAAAGYWTMDLFIKMLEKVGPDLTRDSFMKVANGDFSYDYGGGATPVTFPKAHTQVTPCFAFVQSNGKGFTVPVPFQCVPLVANPIYKKP